MQGIIKGLERMLTWAMLEKDYRAEKELAYATSLAELLRDELQRQFNETLTQEVIENETEKNNKS